MTDSDGGATSDPPGDTDPRPDVAATAGALADELEALREQLREGRRGPFGLPAPPTPRELLRFTDRHAIPFAIAVLEANIRALELLQGAIRLVESGDRARAETTEGARSARRRATELSRATLERLDGVLADLETAARDEELPPEGPAREIVAEARRLRDELAAALEPTEDADPAALPRDGGDPPTADAPGTPAADAEATADATSGEASSTTDEDPVPVDVEGELRSIREELGAVDDGADPGEGTPATDAGGEADAPGGTGDDGPTDDDASTDSTDGDRRPDAEDTGS